MRYAEVDFLVAPLEPWRDILMVELVDLGYEGFEETSHGLRAYRPFDSFDGAALHKLLVLRDPHATVTYSMREVPDINWNEQWERSFQPVEVGDQVRVRAEFHPADPAFAHEIVITPRMAFGTGHHATTRMMITAMLDMDLHGRSVCDLGCGTAVLSILAEQRGAARVLALDNDPQAVDNAKENVSRNKCQHVVVENAQADSLDHGTYGIILANIERNTLIRAMPVMERALEVGGTLLLSGFIRDDKAVMQAAAEHAGMRTVLTMEEGEWALLACMK